MDRRLYDLCRKYRHFYNKYKDVESWNRKYHDIDLSSAVEKTASQLSSVEDEMLKELFRVYKFYPMSIDIDREFPYGTPTMFMNRIKRLPNFCSHSVSKIEVRDAERFIKLLSEHMYDVRRYNEMR